MLTTTKEKQEFLELYFDTVATAAMETVEDALRSECVGQPASVVNDVVMLGMMKLAAKCSQRARAIRESTPAT